MIYREITAQSDLFKGEILSGGQLELTAQHTRLTTTEPGSYGGLFLKNATEFEGPGGFSTKFTLRATTTTGSGEAWEFIVAHEDARFFAEPPFAVGSANHGKGGWSRKRALVVEFDDRNSGSGEGDSGADSSHHIAVFLDGAEQCAVEMPSGTVFEDGAKYTVWIDYIGFKSTLEIFVGSPNSSVRPAEPTLRCAVDVWGALNIREKHHVGFAAYNSPDAIGVEHSLVDGIFVVDAYRPFDKFSCVTFAQCREKDDKTLCVVPTTINGICELKNCDRNHVWDITGGLCCAFIEKASWVVKGDVIGFDSLGDRAPCELARKTISFVTDNSNCTQAV